MGIVQSNCPYCNQENYRETMADFSWDFDSDIFYSGFDEDQYEEPKDDPNVLIMERLEKQEQRLDQMGLRFSEVKTDLGFNHMNREKMFLRVMAVVVAYCNSNSTKAIPLVEFVKNYKRLMKSTGRKSDVEMGEIKFCLFSMNYDSMTKEGMTYILGLEWLDIPRTDYKSIFQEATKQMKNKTIPVNKNNLENGGQPKEQSERQQRRPSEIQNRSVTDTIKSTSSRIGT